MDFEEGFVVWNLEHWYEVFTWPDGSQYEGKWAYDWKPNKGHFINDKVIEKEGI